MRVLLFGATGNLGSRLIPALLAHNHTVTVFIRSPEKLRSLVSSQLVDSVTVVQGDALDSQAIEAALRAHNCDALVNTAHNQTWPWRQTPASIAASVSAAAVTVGKERGGEPLRAWFFGVLGSIEYPGTGGWKIQDYMPLLATRHHRDTEAVLKAVGVEDLAWTLLCVAMMVPESKVIETLERPRGHGLRVSVKGPPPAWRDSWIRVLPVVGVYLNLVPVVVSYTTKLEDVADLIAENLAQGHGAGMIGELVSMKDVGDKKAV